MSTASHHPAPAQASRLLTAALVLVAVVAAAQHSDLPAELEPYAVRLAEEGALNRVLNLERLGLAAMRLGHHQAAEQALDEALDRMEGFYVDSETVAKVRSRWYEEGCKEFLGEPYERAMAYFYRGVLHMQDGEYDDARACFKSAILQDAFAEEEQHRCDFALVVYLYGLACRALGDTTGMEDSFKDAALLMPKLDVRVRPRTRYLVIVEAGGAPRKLADGLGHGELKYARARNRKETDAVLTRGSSDHEAEMFEDIYWQASTRGGRAVDKIIEGKVIFQETTTEAAERTARAGDVARLVGIADDNANLVGVGAGLSLIGGITQLFAAKAKPRADTRYWDNLPESVLLFELPPSAAAKPYHVRFLDVYGRELEQYRQEVRVDPDCHLPLCTVFVPSPTHQRGEAGQ